MNKMLKLITITIGVIILLFTYYTTSYAVERLVDIPVPPNSAGKSDFTSEEGEKEAQQYEENKINEEQNTSEVTQEYIKKSGNNYLKSLTVEGYKLEPQFNKQEDEYIVYVADINNVKNLNIIAEVDDTKAKVQGAGSVEITPENNIITINVIAENGNLKVYTIKIENQSNKPQDKSKGIEVMIATIIVVLIIGIIVIIADKKSKH